MKVANIIYDGELVNHERVDFINYYEGETQYEAVDTSLPTLYVGWAFMKKCNPNNDLIRGANILDAKIQYGLLYWEFSFDERKTSHINGVSNFVDVAPYHFFGSKYAYINLDPIFTSIRTFDDLIKFIPDDVCYGYQFKNEFLYLTTGTKIFGMDLRLYSFIGFDLTQIYEYVMPRCDKYYNDSDGDFYSKIRKTFSDYPQLRRYMGFILSN